MQWENMFKNNVMGCLRTARAFIGLLKPTRGRLILLGSGNDDDGLVVFTATRNAVEGCAGALRKELKPYGINVVTLDSHGVPAESLFKAPVPFSE
jgi:NAD(P)-dependent dehydrogenase (short-subunit alcohol dehydrogenase family)